MSACPAFGGGMTDIAQALRAVDCHTGEATAFAFGRLFGADGRLLPALTLLLTLYVAFFAIQLLTGRSRIGVGALTPRMLTLGLALTFATSWAAYQNVVWTLATGAPDQVATLLTGTHGSATDAFAGRLDRLFTAVADTAQAASKPAAPTATGITPATPMVGGFTASTVLWLSAIMLLLGTVGVLVTAKIALAAMLAVGPLFIVLALFRGTRGLFEGWVKAVVLFAVVPLFAVLIGGGAVMALEPVAREIALDGSEPSTQAVTVLFLGAAVYVALMAMALKTATTLVAGWRLPGSRDDEERAVAAPPAPAPSSVAAVAAGDAARMATPYGGDERIRGIVTALPAPGSHASGAGYGERAPAFARRTAEIIPIGGAAAPLALADQRGRGIGSRFRARPAALTREHVS